LRKLARSDVINLVNTIPHIRYKDNMKIFGALVIFLLAHICSVADAGVDPPLFWPVVTEYSDDVCTIRTGYGVRSETVREFKYY
jgi:hypothetical protein